MHQEFRRWRGPPRLPGGKPSRGRWAARVAHQHFCVQSVPAPHKGGRIVTGATSVLVEQRFAARVSDHLMCEAGAAPNQIALGRFDVIIEGRFAARQWDITTHGGMIQQGERQVQYGTYAAGDRIALVIMRIRLSEYGQTEEGRRVVAKLEDLAERGFIDLDEMPYWQHGSWKYSDGLKINERHADDIELMASVAVHEATHAIIDDEDPSKRNSKQPMDDEQRAWDQGLEFYQEQRRHGADERDSLDRYQSAKKRGPDEAREYLDDLYYEEPSPR